VVLLLASCAPPAETDSVRVGLFVPLTGSQASFGQSVKRGVDLAAGEINAAGGVLGGREIRIVGEDTQGKSEEASTAATRLITIEKVAALIGEASSSNTLAAAPICQQRRVPLVTPTATRDDVTEAGDYIFRVCFVDSFQGRVMADFAAASLRVRRVAILQDASSAYSTGLTESFTRAFTSSGGEIVSLASYGDGDTNFAGQLTEIRSHEPEAVFVPGYYDEAGLIVRQARALGIEVPILGTDGWVSETLGSIAGEGLNNTFISTPFSTEDAAAPIQAFIAAYRARYGEEPEAGSALGYEAMKVLAAAIDRSGSAESEKIRDALAATRDLPGVTGTITIDERRNPIKPATVVEHVFENGRLRQVFRAKVEGQRGAGAR
jgi:branched-chain amino acid transport system substrate-binding protein